jgi:hypothetical protein
MRRHEGTNYSAFPATPFSATLLSTPSGHGGRPVALATVARAHGGEIRGGTGVDQRLTLFRTVDRLSFTQTQEQNR